MSPWLQSSPRLGLAASSISACCCGSSTSMSWAQYLWIEKEYKHTETCIHQNFHLLHYFVPSKKTLEENQ